MAPVASGERVVLVVDDDADVALLCRLHLESAGFVVLAAPDGGSGVVLAGERLPAVIVLDFMLPDMDGMAVLEALRADPSTAAIPVVMLTARTDLRDQQAAWEAGVSEYLTKPFDADRLVAAVADAIAPGGDPKQPTRRREAIDRLRARDIKALEQLASIVEHSEDAIISKSLDGVVTSWNQAATDLYGYEADEIIGQPISVLVPLDHIDEIPEILRRIARGEHVTHFETVRQCRRSPRRCVAGRIADQERSGRGERRVGDIPRRHRAAAL